MLSGDFHEQMENLRNDIRKLEEEGSWVFSEEEPRVSKGRRRKKENGRPTGAVMQEFRDHAHDLRRDVEKLWSDFGGITRTVLELGKSEAAEARQKLAAKATTQLEALKSAVAATRRRSQQAIEGLSHRFESSPILSVLGSLGVGFAIGVALVRSRNR